MLAAEEGRREEIAAAYFCTVRITPGGSDAEQLLAEADRRMYRAKRKAKMEAGSFQRSAAPVLMVAR